MEGTANPSPTPEPHRPFLPLMEFALKALWEARQGERLRYDVYTDMGGVKGAIAARAESVYQRLRAEQQTVAEKVFAALVRLGEETGDTRRRAPLSDSKVQLWAWQRAIVVRLAALCLTVHQGSAQVEPVTAGIPRLGFVVYPTHRRVKARKVVQGTRWLTDRFDAWQAGRVSFADFDASVSGWINHVRYADSWGLREHVFSRFVWGPQPRCALRGERACG